MALSPAPQAAPAMGALYAPVAETAVVAVEAAPPLRDLLGLHTRLVEMWEESEEASRTNRGKAERDTDYRDGKQWTEAEVKALKKRGQPAITHPLIRQKIDYLLGLERAQRTDPRALPRNPNPMDEGAAEAATDALRYVCEQQRYDQTRSRAWEDILVPGWGGVEVGVKQTMRGNILVTIARCAWDRMFSDPYSSEVNYSDANYLGMVRWMDREEAMAEYGPQAREVFDECFAGNSTTETYDDRPRNVGWVQWGKRRRVRVVLIYYKDPDGVWNYAEFTKGGYLREGVSPYLDDDGQPEHPYVWRSGYIDRDNNRSGVVRDLIDLQDEVNKRRSKAMHAINSRQTYGNQKLPDVNSLRREMARVDGHVDMQGDAEFGKDFGIIPTNDIAQGNLTLLQQAMNAFEILGPNAAMQGKGTQDQSGRAIIAQQQGGAIQMGTLSDTLRDMDHEVYRKIWRRIRQFWSEQTWVRVTDDEQKPKWVGLNSPMPDPETGLPAVDPMTGQPVVQNNVAEMDIDIIVDDAPQMASLQGEQFAKLVDLGKIGIRFPDKLYLAASDLRNKGDLIRMLDEAAQSQQPNPLQQAAQQLEMRGAAAKVALTEAQALKAQGDTQLAEAEAVHRYAQAQNANSLGDEHAVHTARAVADIAHKTAQTRKMGLETAQMEMGALGAPVAPQAPYEQGMGW